MIDDDAGWMPRLAHLVLHLVEATPVARAQHGRPKRSLVRVGRGTTPECLPADELNGMIGCPGAAAAYLDDVSAFARCIDAEALRSTPRPRCRGTSRPGKCSAQPSRPQARRPSLRRDRALERAGRDQDARSIMDELDALLASAGAGTP